MSTTRGILLGVAESIHPQAGGGRGGRRSRRRSSSRRRRRREDEWGRMDSCALVAILGDGSIVTWVLLAVGLTAELSRIR